MLGPSLLVAPVFAPDGVVDYYLPEGLWTNVLTGEVVKGGRWLREAHGYLSLPLLARPNAIIPVGSNEERPDYPYAEGVTFHLFGLQEGATVSASVPTTDGRVAIQVVARKRGQQINLEAQGTTTAWSALLPGVNAVHRVEGGRADPDALGTRVTPAPGATALTIEL
jgi:alpha-D-xyloside xylohydrolase